MRETRRTVCTKANALIRKGWKRSDAFKWAWAKVKKEQSMTKASDLKSGDVVSIELGESGNCGTVKVVAVTPSPLFKDLLIVKADNHGNEIEFCVSPADLFKKVA